MIPTPDQILLLRACLLSGSDAVTAWKSWRERVNFDDIDAASYRLMPMLYQNLRREKMDDGLMGRLKGIYRHTWSRNQFLFHEAGRVMKAMNDAGIPALVLKGATLASSFYSDAGLRPMNDFDVMVPLDETSRSFELMQTCGWNYVESVPLKQLVWCSHAGKWMNRNGQQIDLHWHLLPEGRQPGVDDDLWAHSTKIEINGQFFPAMGETDLLWHVCVHGAVGDEISPIRWVADAWTILQSKLGAIGWNRLVKTTQRRHLTLVVGRALSFLREEFNAPVPAHVIEELERTPHSWLEHWENRIKSSPRGLLGALPLHCVNYIRLTRHDNLWRKIAGAPVFFQRTWGISGVRGLPGYVIKKAVNRLAANRQQTNNS